MREGVPASLRLQPAVGGRPSGVYWVAASAVCGVAVGGRDRREDGVGPGAVLVAVDVTAERALATGDEGYGESLGDFVDLCEVV